MTNTTISFQHQVNGYDKDEVDRYIKKLASAYQTAYEEYTAVCGKYNGLLEDYEKLCGERDKNNQGVAVIAKTLVDTEAIAQQIIADAQIEAGKIAAEAQSAAQRVKENAYIESASVKLQAQKLIEGASSEAADTHERAEKLIGMARNEAAQINLLARRNLEQTEGSVRQAIGMLQKLLAPEPQDKSDAENAKKLTFIPLCPVETAG